MLPARQYGHTGIALLLPIIAMGAVNLIGWGITGVMWLLPYLKEGVGLVLVILSASLLGGCEMLDHLSDR